jgi:hypothetical protein
MLMTTFGGYAVAIGYFHGVNMVRVYKSWHNTSKKKKSLEKINALFYHYVACQGYRGFLTYSFFFFLPL